MKRRLEESVAEEQTGGTASILGAPQDGQTNKKAKPTLLNEDTGAAHAQTNIPLSELPDLVLHHLVRGLVVEDALRLRATSAFWADMVVRDHPLAALLVGELLPRLASLPASSGDDNDDDSNHDSRSEDMIEEHGEQKYESERESESENEAEEEESLESDLAWMMEDTAEAARLAEEEAQKKRQEQEQSDFVSSSHLAPETSGGDVDPRWALLQEVRIAADARLHELRLRSPDYWRDTALYFDAAGDGASVSDFARAARQRSEEQDEDDGDLNEEDEFGRPRKRQVPLVVDIETQLNDAEALSLASERVRVRATAKRSSGKNSTLVTHLKLELPPTPGPADEQDAVYFCIEYGSGLNSRSGSQEAALRVNQSSTPTGDRTTVVSSLLTTGELWNDPQFMRQWFVELAAKLGVSWTPWQLASFVVRCAGVEPQVIRDFHADIFARAWVEDPVALYHLRSRYDGLPELLDVTSRVRAISSPDLLSALSAIAARWQYRLQLAQMWHLSAELDWPSADQIARLASCVRSGCGDVVSLCPVDYGEVLAADCRFQLSIVVPPDQAGHDDEQLEIEVECRHTASLAYDCDNENQSLVLTARGLNDFARRRLGTQSPTDKKTLLQLSCDAPKPAVVAQEDTALLELIGRALDLHCEPDENPRFYRGGRESNDNDGDDDDKDVMSSQDQDWQEDDDDASLAATMWDAKRVGYFLALCSLTPANSYEFQYQTEEEFLVGYKPRFMWSQDPRQRLAAHLDVLVHPGQVWAPDTS